MSERASSPQGPTEGEPDLEILKYHNNPPPPGISQPLPHYSLEEAGLHHLTTTAAIDLKKRTAELHQSSKLAQVTEVQYLI